MSAYFAEPQSLAPVENVMIKHFKNASKAPFPFSTSYISINQILFSVLFDSCID